MPTIKIINRRSFKNKSFFILQVGSMFLSELIYLQNNSSAITRDITVNLKLISAFLFLNSISS